MNPSQQVHGGSGGYLATTTVPKTCVIAYFDGRGEREIVLNPRPTRRGVDRGHGPLNVP